MNSKLSVDVFKIDTETPMPMYRFANSADLKALFQTQIDRFPRVQVNDVKQLMFSEFGGIMIRPQGEPQDQLTHILFPETSLSIPRAGRSLRHHSDITFPQARLMVDVATNSLYAQVMADHSTDDELTERVSLILSTNDVFFNSDLWKYFSKHDQQILSQFGFGPGMTFEEWAITITNYPAAFLSQYETNGRITTFKELPLNINQRGNIGTLNSYHQMPGFILYALLQNIFTEDDFYEIGSAHIHPEKEFKGLSEAVAKIIGERKTQMTISPADVRVIRGSFDSNKIILGKHGEQNKRTGESFISIVGVDSEGKVKDIQHHDFGLIDNMQEMNDLNDRTLETFGKSNPDIGLIAEHYEFFSDPSMASNELNGEVGSHVGDRTYVSKM